MNDLAKIEAEALPEPAVVVEDADKLPFEPSPEDRQRVKYLAIAGTPASIMRMVVFSPYSGRMLSEADFKKVFAREIAIADAEVNVNAVSGIIRAIEEEKPWALTFWARTKMGWIETQRHEVAPAPVILNKEQSEF